MGLVVPSSMIDVGMCIPAFDETMAFLRHIHLASCSST